MLLVFGAMVGIVVAFVAYFFLKGVAEAQQYIFATLPTEVGFDSEPVWWPLPWPPLAGLLVALTIRYLPGTAGHKPAEGFKTGGPVMPIELPGIVLASLATLCLGVVLGPEAPLIAIGSGIGVLAVHLVKKDAPAQAVAVIGAAGSFAAISTLLGNPLVGAFLLMEAAGLAGPLLGVVLVPGLLAAGVGALIFVGLSDWTGYGTFSLAIPGIPPFGSPDGAEFLWAIAIGVIAAVLGAGIRRLGLALQPIVERRSIALTPVVGLGVAGLAIAFAEVTGKSSSEVLFSGQEQLPQAHPVRRRLVGRSPRAPPRLQGTRIWSLVEQLPRRPGLSGSVPRRRTGDRPLTRPGPAADRRGRHGDRRDERRDAQPAADVGPPRKRVSRLGRGHPDAAHHRRRGRVLRQLGLARPANAASQPCNEHVT